MPAIHLELWYALPDAEPTTASAGRMYLRTDIVRSMPASVESITADAIDG